MDVNREQLQHQDAVFIVKCPTRSMGGWLCQKLSAPRHVEHRRTVDCESQCELKEMNFNYSPVAGITQKKTSAQHQTL